MFEDDNTSTSFDQLFEDDSAPESDEIEADKEEVEVKPDKQEEPAEEEESVEEESEEEESEAEDDKTPKIIATIEIDGQEFPLDEMKVQKLAENYVEVAQQNRVFQKDREQVVEVMKYIENIRSGKDVDEAMKALGVDFDNLIRDKVKDFIRRSTLSAKERELEDANKEREILRKKIKEREEAEAAAKEQEESQRTATLIIDSVNMAVSKIPEDSRKEIQLEVFGAIERRIRAGGMPPSQKSIENAVQTIYNRKYKKDPAKVTKEVPKPPKVVKNSPKPSTTQKKKVYNATDYSELFS